MDVFPDRGSGIRTCYPGALLAMASVLLVATACAGPTPSEVPTTRSITPGSAEPSVEPVALPPTWTPIASPLSRELITSTPVRPSPAHVWEFDRVDHLAWSPDGSKFAASVLAAGSAELWVVSPRSPDQPLVIAAPGSSAASFSPDGERIFIPHSVAGYLREFNSQSGEPIAETPGSPNCSGGDAIYWSEQLLQFLTVHSSGQVEYQTEVFSWNDETAECAGRILETPGWAVSSSMSPSGKYLAIGLATFDEEEPEYAGVWDLEGGAERCRLEGGAAIAFAGSDEGLLTTDLSGATSSWNLRDCSGRSVVPPIPTPFAVSHDGNLYAVGTPARITINSTRTGRVLTELDSTSQGQVGLISFDPTGQFLLVATKETATRPGKLLLFQIPERLVPAAP